MAENIIGASQAAIDAYESEALAIFTRVGQQMQQLVASAFALTYVGPDADTVFNPGLLRLATESVAAVDEAMSSFAAAVSTVTSNISRSLGAGDIVFAYHPPPLDLPAPPGIAADDYRIDIAGFDAFLGSELPGAERAMAALFARNQEAFEAIPRATAGSPGWSGDARDHAQQVVVPRQTEHLNAILRHVAGQITDFLTEARDGALRADQAGMAA